MDYLENRGAPACWAGRHAAQRWSFEKQKRASKKQDRKTKLEAWLFVFLV